ncbi:MAG: hypothetical protein ABFD96_17265 [Armatimonadia bacterium]
MFTWRVASVFATAIVLSLLVCLVGSCQPVDTVPGAVAVQARQTEAEAAFDGLVQDIDLLYTVNRLDLQKNQHQPLSDLVARVQAEKDKLQPARQAALAELIPALREKRALLVQDKPVPADLEERIRASQAKLDEGDEAVTQTSAKFVPDLKKLLSPEQVAIITGADEAHAQAEELLQWVREMDAGTFAEEGKANAAELADPELKLPADAIMKIFNDARKLSEADYDKQRETFITKLSPLYMPMQEAADSALLEFFAAPRLGAILKEKLG